MSHKAYCKCARCEQARELQRKLASPRPKLPNFVYAQIREKAAQKEEEMLRAGYILFECPSCQHQAYTKIAPQMKCACCARVYA